MNRNKIFSFIAILCLLAGAAISCKNNEAVPANPDFSKIASQTLSGNLDHGGLNRDYLIHFPKKFTVNNRYPLLVALHGGFGKTSRFERYTRLSEKADNENFMVVYPQGVLRSWNAGWCCGPAHKNNIDDVGFLSALIDSLTEQYPIDTEHVFVTGISNGGFMAYRLLCEKPRKITAIAPVAASMLVESCQPDDPGSILHIHSYQDEYVPYQGGKGSGPSGAYKPPVDSVLSVWSDINGCTTPPDTLTQTSRFDLIEWRNCDQNTQIQLYLTHDGGHSWPGASTTFPDPASEAINANDVMWDFFSSSEE